MSECNERECYVCGNTSNLEEVKDFDKATWSPYVPQRYICKSPDPYTGSGKNGTLFPTCHMKYYKHYKCGCCRVSRWTDCDAGYVFLESDNTHYNVVCHYCYNKALGITDFQFIGDGAVLEKVQQYRNKTAAEHERVCEEERKWVAASLTHKD